MTLFEYLAIAYALLLSLSTVRLLDGLSHILHADRRYWAHAIWVCLLIFFALLLFWHHWSTLNVRWTFLTFVMNLAGPGVIYFLSCTLIPDEAKDVDSWRDYYFSIRRQFFGALCVWSVFMVINTTLILGVPPLHVSRIIPAGLMLLGLSGLSTDSPQVHAGILLVLLFILIIAVVILLQPGALAN